MCKVEAELPLGKDDARLLLCPEKVRDLRMDGEESHDLGLPFTLQGGERGESHTWGLRSSVLSTLWPPLP